MVMPSSASAPHQLTSAASSTQPTTLSPTAMTSPIVGQIGPSGSVMTPVIPQCMISFASDA